MQLLVRYSNFLVPFCAVLTCVLNSSSGLMTTSHEATGETRPLRFGVFSTAGINTQGIIGPTMTSPQVAIITAIASRDTSHATEYKQKNGGSLKFATIYETYQDLLDNADIDAVYNPLPNGLHYEWTMKALKAGKHVLCEKPFASNAQEARIMVDFAKEKGLVLMEGFHWSYHPFRARMQEILKSGKIGTIQNISVVFTQGSGDPLSRIALLTHGSDVMGWRMSSELAGGTMMDLGCYCLDVMRILVGELPVLKSVKAQPLLSDPNIDAQMSGTVSFLKSGIQGSFDASFLGPAWASTIEVTGTQGIMREINFNQPHFYNTIEVLNTKGDVISSEHVDGHGLTTFDSQLLAFADHVQKVRTGLRDAVSFVNTGEDPVEMMKLLDQAYSMAGLRPRQGPSGIVPH